MSGIPLVEKYGHYFSSLSKLTKAASVIDETNVYQEENPATRKIMNAMVAGFIFKKPGTLYGVSASCKRG